MRKSSVPAFRLARGPAAGLGAFLYLADEAVGDLDRPGDGLEADGVAHRIVGGEKSVAAVEQMRPEPRGSGEGRGDGECTGLGLAIGNKRRLRHVAATGRIAHDMDSGL